MKAGWAIDTTEIENEIEILRQMKANVMRGWLEVGRDDDNRLVFRMTTTGREYVESMGKKRR